MKVIVISGLSGAGKSRAGEFLEDAGYYTVDNMPHALMPTFVQLAQSHTSKRYERVAMVCDIRSGQSFESLFQALEQMKAMGCDCRLLFLESTTETIIARYKETRRAHPLAVAGESLESTIARERKLLAPVRARADYILDSSRCNTTAKLRSALLEMFAEEEDVRPTFSVVVQSFGFKHGLPLEADWVMDVRFLPNPFYIRPLRLKTGLDREVAEYLEQSPATGEFLEKMREMLALLLPLYEEEGKSTLIIGMGCTGGQHRSVYMAHAVAMLAEELGYSASEYHRDINKERK